MTVLGIIVEYNPFHNGHLYHLKRSKDITNSDAVIAVMSGDVVQRGEFASFSKWKRAEWALLGGVDLVIELPYIYACSSANYFAKGAIDILNKTNIVNNICFGVEHDNIDTMKYIADRLNNETDDFKLSMKKYLKEGYSYPQARTRSFIDNIEKENITLDEINNIMSSPNNILAIEYIRNLKMFNSKINVNVLKRKGADYHDEIFSNRYIASATSIRKASNNKINVSNVVPNFVNKDIFDEFTTMKGFYTHFISILKRKHNNIRNIEEGNKELEFKIYNEIERSQTFEEFLHNVKSKNITMTRIKRLCMNIILNLTKEDAFNLRQGEIQYFRILGFNKKGKELLKKMKKCDIPVLTNLKYMEKQFSKKQFRSDCSINFLLNEYNYFKMIGFDILASDLKNIITEKKIIPKRETKHAPIQTIESAYSEKLYHSIEKSLTF